MATKTTIAFLSDRPIAYHPILAKMLGSVTAALFLSQLLYWRGKGWDEDWIWKTQSEMFNETGLTRYEQETARRKLRDLKILQEERRGIPAKMYFRVDLIILEKLLQTRMVEYHILECGKPPNKKAEIHHSIPERTNRDYKSENTAKRSIPDGIEKALTPIFATKKAKPKFKPVVECSVDAVRIGTEYYKYMSRKFKGSRIILDQQISEADELIELVGVDKLELIIQFIKDTKDSDNDFYYENVKSLLKFRKTMKGRERMWLYEIQDNMEGNGSRVKRDSPDKKATRELISKRFREARNE